MVGFDVQSLFTNVPFSNKIQICLDRLYPPTNPDIVPLSLPVEVLKGMIELCVKANDYVSNKKLYFRKNGVAMGNLLGPLLANIYMVHLKETYMHGCQHSPDHYWRYVDDSFYLFRNKEDVA